MGATQLYLDQVKKDLKEWREKRIEIIKLFQADKKKIAGSFAKV